MSATRPFPNTLIKFFPISVSLRQIVNSTIQLLGNLTRSRSILRLGLQTFIHCLPNGHQCGILCLLKFCWQNRQLSASHLGTHPILQIRRHLSSRRMSSEYIEEDVAQCVDIYLFGERFGLVSALMVVHFLRCSPPRFAKSTLESTRLFGLRIPHHEFGNVEIVEFGSTPFDYGDIPRVEIVMNHRGIASTLMTGIHCGILDVIRIINAMYVRNTCRNHGRQLQFNFTDRFDLDQSAELSRYFFQTGQPLDAEVGQFVDGRLAAVAVDVHDVG
mmetsp:Transcript_22952/g.46029  ORF Transcript_22952/g.46029 Transcript_22952/m.46029 type:complete len:273 (+) Transcript_22952:131-949(+)